MEPLVCARGDSEDCVLRGEVVEDGEEEEEGTTAPAELRRLVDCFSRMERRLSAGEVGVEEERARGRRLLMVLCKASVPSEGVDGGGERAREGPPVLRSEVPGEMEEGEEVEGIGAELARERVVVKGIDLEVEVFAEDADVGFKAGEKEGEVAAGLRTIEEGEDADVGLRPGENLLVTDVVIGAVGFGAEELRERGGERDDLGAEDMITDDL